jgi:hypothetical protein
MLSDHIVKIPFKHYDFNIQHSRKYYCVKNNRKLRNKLLCMIQYIKQICIMLTGQLLIYHLPRTVSNDLKFSGLLGY